MGVVRGVRVKKEREAAEEEVKLFDDETEGDEADARPNPGEKRPFGGQVDRGSAGSVTNRSQEDKVKESFKDSSDSGFRCRHD